MAGMGMIGMIGGVGGAFENNARFIEGEEKADAAAARSQKLEAWRMATREQYDIRSEGRAEDRTVRSEDRAEDRTIRTEKRTDRRGEEQKDRDFGRLQTEAPVRRGIKVEDEKASARGKSDVGAETLDQDAERERRLAEAKETESTRDLRGAQSEYYRDRPTAGSGAGKMDPTIKDELDDLQTSIREKRKLVDQGRADGSWDDNKLTAGQKKIQAELIASEKRARVLLAQARGGGATATASGSADPLKLRERAQGGGGTGSAPGDSDRAAIYQQEFRQASQRLAAAKTPEEQRRAQGDIEALRREASAIGVSLDGQPAMTPAAAPSMVGPAAPAKSPAPAAAAPAQPAAKPGTTPQQALDKLTGGGAADPLEQLGQQVDATRRDLRDAQAKPPGLAAGGPARQEYQQKVTALRERLRTLEKQYEVGMSVAPGVNTGPARTYARP